MIVIPGRDEVADPESGNGFGPSAGFRVRSLSLAPRNDSLVQKLGRTCQNRTTRSAVAGLNMS
jgi:hypothetical protein